MSCLPAAAHWWSGALTGLGVVRTAGSTKAVGNVHAAEQGFKRSRSVGLVGDRGTGGWAGRRSMLGRSPHALVISWRADDSGIASDSGEVALVGKGGTAALARRRGWGWCDALCLKRHHQALVHGWWACLLAGASAVGTAFMDPGVVRTDEIVDVPLVVWVVAHALTAIRLECGGWSRLALVRLG